jgi:hypothetical protein
MFAGQARHRFAGRTISARLKLSIAPPALAALSDQKTIADARKIAE